MTPSPSERTAPSAASPLRSWCLAALLIGLALGASWPALLEAAEPDSVAAPSPQSLSPTSDSLTVPAPEAASDTLRQPNQSLPSPNLRELFGRIREYQLRRAAERPDPASFVASQGFENVSMDSSRGELAYENRRFRHAAFARGVVHLDARLLGLHRTRVERSFERRLGMVAAAVVEDSGFTSGVPAAVLFPSDRDFPSPPTGPVLSSTRRSVDLELVPLFAYELGRVLDPVLVRVELEPRLRANPWPGARATAGIIIPLRNDFELDDIHPDIDRVRPGPITLEQFMWLRGVALLSGTGGIFADNRYGVSLGAARPLAGGAFLLDAQADLTGYLAFPATGPEISTMDLFTGFAGVTWHPPKLDLGVRLRAERFLYGDHGGELELRRAMGDLNVAFFYQRTGGLSVHGVRLMVPMPPTIRRHATAHTPGLSVRAQLVDRLPIDYRDESAPVGRVVKSVASREDYLRQLDRPGLAANAYRYRDGSGYASETGVRPTLPRVSLTGMTGFINTPWCGVMSDRGVEVGYNRIPKEAAYDHRGTHANDVYYAALGFLPHLEAGLRWTVIPGLRAFTDVVPDSRLTDSDRMLSGRLELLPATPRRPGLAIGVEDAVGTRRFHSTYAVTGIPFAYPPLNGRVSLGYAPRVFKRAGGRTLDGAFGALEASPWRPVAVALEYDTEKWNTALGIDLGFGFRARAALLGGRHASFGAGWSVPL
jgi:exopolysaccharide biosynthesis protein YbjH